MELSSGLYEGREPMHWAWLNGFARGAVVHEAPPMDDEKAMNQCHAVHRYDACPPDLFMGMRWYGRPAESARAEPLRGELRMHSTNNITASKCIGKCVLR
jgi:hypothetical protein